MSSNKRVIIQHPVTGADINPDAPAVVIPGGTMLGQAQRTNAQLAASGDLGTIPAGASYVWLQALGQNVSIRLDGTEATASNGLTLYAGQPPIVVRCTLADIRAIRAADGATLNVVFFG